MLAQTEQEPHNGPAKAATQEAQQTAPISRHWSRSDLLYLAMGTSLIVWPIIEMSVRKDIDQNFILVITLGVVVVLMEIFYFNKNRTNKS